MLVKESISIDSFSLYLTKKTSSLLQGKHRLLVAIKAAKIDILIGFLFDSAFPGKPFKSVGGTIYLDNWVFFLSYESIPILSPVFNREKGTKGWFLATSQEMPRVIFREDGIQLTSGFQQSKTRSVLRVLKKHKVKNKVKMQIKHGLYDENFVF
ncbi:hypothetical protein [Bacillus mojavensis]|uniref:Uncharacterized protein n=1 Tax=Bacillus mojavensis TaxID=72360 RepID=A0AAP3CSU6_BACMO|nr:hypothetical protein [Bacillus mojavensis]MCY8104769.1 hypothetical protein [Bacillus mojavensis]MCY8482134.1 hypothetical protein [Bacillus mojavensis]MCY8510334.1 hypothetical protein [Bacillus mojavensis]MEC1673629.1 hypothetical protein [Bacillus mojavensis]MEC1753432.1 hypothetical protein [Bacillus mojavensis]